MVCIWFSSSIFLINQMTIEQLLEVSVDELESMSDSKLMEHLEPYLKLTKPDELEELKIQKKRRGKIKID